METKKATLAVEWTEVRREDVPIVLVTGLEVLAVDRFLQFMRPHNPNHARYSPTNEGKRAVPMLTQFA
jgi:hypothetical protein